MTYDFGDIIDARNVPDIGHFIVVVGEIKRKDKISGETVEEIMYYKITSHVYAVFKSILAYYNNCLSRKDVYFLRFYSKEKDNFLITPYGLLSQAVFLDRDTYYSTCLDTESMVVINCEPKLYDKKVFKVLKKDGKIIIRNKLTKFDAINLMNAIRHSKDTSKDKRLKVGSCFSKVIDTFK